MKAGADGEPFGVFVLAAVRFACLGMKKKPSAPLLRLSYIHLLASLYEPIGHSWTE